MSLPARQARRNQEIRPLSHGEIERRIRELTAEALGLANPGRGRMRPAEECRPRWVTAELVRRMRPFIVYN